MCKHKMDATPSFGVTMIPEVPSNPQLTLNSLGKGCWKVIALPKIFPVRFSTLHCEQDLF